MIGSLIFYALFPLTKLFSKISELWLKGHPVIINGTEVWNGGGATCRMLKEQRIALPDQRHNPRSETLEKARHADSDGAEDERLVESGFLLEIREVVSEEKREHENVLNLKRLHEDTHKVIHSVELIEQDPDHSGDGKAFMSVLEKDDSILTEEQQKGCSQSRQSNIDTSLLMEEKKEVALKIEKELLSTIELAEIQPTAAAPVESKMELSSQNERKSDCGIVTVQQAIHDNLGLTKKTVPTCINENRLLEVTADGVEKNKASCCKVPVKQSQAEVFTNEVHMETESGGSAVKMASPGFDLSALLADTHAMSLNNLAQLQSVPTGWHFPVGPGLSEIVHCPVVQFPGMSYYPAFQENNSFEVMWRVWEDCSENSDQCRPQRAACKAPSSVFNFTIMSYNILAQDLLEANSHLYQHCSYVIWENRFHNILKEFQTWEPDIICLQEVQEDHFVEQMHPALIELGMKKQYFLYLFKTLEAKFQPISNYFLENIRTGACTCPGYSCVYKRRTGSKTDGCMVGFHSSRFTQLSISLLEFCRDDCELLDRDNVGIVLLLQPVQDCSEDPKLSSICVANTHLLFNPRRGDVKLAQLAIVLAEIDSVVKQWKAKGQKCEIILCGDFNALPNMPLYQLIVSGQLYYHGLPAWMVSGQEDLSYKMHHRRLYAPLWPKTLGINDNCQYSTLSEPRGRAVSGKLQYDHDFLQQLRYCPTACVRPLDLELIPGVTDNIPKPEEKQLFVPSFRNTLHHGFNLSSVYDPGIEGTDHCVVTTLHSEGAAMVDYIFYSTGKNTPTAINTGQEGGLRLLGRLALLSEADLWSLNGLPNEIFPSDHLSLLARFQLC